MIRSSLEFAPGTAEKTKNLVRSLPAYDLLIAYRRAALEFKTTDIVLMITIHDEEPIAFEAKPRDTEAFKGAARMVHPIARQSAHQMMKIPRDSAAFWLVIEFRDKEAFVCCAVGEIRMQDMPSEAVLD